MERYERYKDSGIEWIGEIPEHWDVKRFIYTFDFSRGLPITKQNLRKVGVPCVNYGEIHSKFGFSVSPEIHPLKCVDSDFLITGERSLLKKGDFIFADTSEDIEGSGNFTCLDSDTPTFAGYHTIIARLKIECSYKYVAYFVDSLQFRSQIRSQVSGIKVFSITQQILKDSTLLFPPPPEQTTIAAYLDRKTSEIDALIAKKKRLLELYEEEKTAIINHAVTKGINPNAPMKDSGIEWLGEVPEKWEVKKLKHIIKKLESGVSVNSVDTPIVGDEFGILKTSCVYDYSFRSYENKAIVSEYELKRAKVNPRMGSIIISRMNTPELVGASGYVEKNYPNLFLPDRLWQTIFYDDTLLNSRWLAFIFESISFRQLISQLATGTSPSMKNIGQSDFLNIEIPYPSVQEQERIQKTILESIQKIEYETTKAKRQMKLMIEYRTAIISEVVTGKVKVHEGFQGE